ncbi:MAG: hypothetical protein Q8P20_01800 [bacterium]|nr:hypothetical protein [bacterium]
MKTRWWFSFKKKNGTYSGDADTVWAASHELAHDAVLEKLKPDEEIVQLRTWWPDCGIA